MEKYNLNVQDTIVLTIEEDKIDSSIIIIKFDGQLDTYNSVKCQLELEKLIKEYGYRKLVINCEKLTYISSMGIGVFAATQKILIGLAGELFFFATNEKVLDVFKQLGFLRFYKFYDSLDEVKNNLNN